MVRRHRSNLIVVLGGVALLLAFVLAGTWWIGDGAQDEFAYPDEPAFEPTAAEDEWHGEAPLADDGFLEDEAIESAPRMSAFDPEVEAAARAEHAATDDAPAGALRARGTLVDALTREPLPEYTFELRDSRRASTVVTTDEHGAFEAEKGLSPGAVHARFFEASPDSLPVGDLRAEEDGQAVQLRLQVASGPTYHFVMTPTPPQPIEGFVARLEGRSSDGRIRVGGKIGGGAAPWIRFRAIPSDAELDGIVVLDSQDGVWHGSGSARVGPGVQRGIVSVRMQVHAALQIVVQEPDGSPLRNALVEWRPDGEARAQSRTTPDDGRTEFVRMSGDPGTLRVRKLRYADYELPMTPRTGERIEQVVRMTLLPSAGSIGGRVLSDTGTYSRAVTVHLLPHAERGGVKQLSARVEWTGKAGARVGTFQFHDLPAGRWRMAVAESDWFEWEPRWMNVETPILDAEFRVHDGVAAADLVFEPIGDDGVPVSDFQVRILSGSDHAAHRGRGKPLVVESFPLESALRWRIDAVGHASAFGEWSSFSPLEAVNGRERRGARIVLDRGAAQMFRVIRSDNKRPIADVVAVVDGREVGRTDESGRIVVRADDASAKIAFRWKEWRMLDAANFANMARRNAPFERTIRLEVPRSERRRR